MRWIKDKLLWVRWFSLLFFLFTSPLFAADIPITPTGPVFQIQPALTWGTTGPGGFNNNFFFTPQNLNGSVCVYVYNNNTTNAHPFTVSINITANPSSKTPSDGTWQNAATTSAIAGASPGLPGGLGATISGVSQVSVNLSGSTTLGGGPETASVTISQTSGSCFSGNLFAVAPSNTVTSFTPLQTISANVQQAYVASQAVTNPASGALLVAVIASGNRTIFANRVTISSSAAATVSINFVSGVGSGCSGAGISNLNQGLTNVNVSTVVTACATPPLAGVAFQPSISIPAGGVVTVDLTPLINRGTNGVSNFGYGISMAAALTGTISVSTIWYEQ